MPVAFEDRAEAGRQLAASLAAYRGRPGVMVLALPRGGVPVAHEVAKALGAPLDVFLVRKLGVPGHKELAMGALASGGVRVIDLQTVRAYGVSAEAISRITTVERQELERQERLYRDGRPVPRVRGLTVILVDDGVATGSTMRAAVTALRPRNPKRIVVAVPVGAPEALRDLALVVDDVVFVKAPPNFYAVGLWYSDFSPVTDDEIRALLGRARRFFSGEQEDISMQTREVPRSEWQEFFDSFSTQHEDWIATLEVSGGGTAGGRIEAHELPFAGVSVDRKGSEPGAVEIELGRTPSDQVTHIIHRARRVLFESTKEGAHVGLEIESAGGERAVLRFRRAAEPEFLDGVKGKRSRRAGG